MSEELRPAEEVLEESPEWDGEAAKEYFIRTMMGSGSAKQQDIKLTTEVMLELNNSYSHDYSGLEGKGLPRSEQELRIILTEESSEIPGSFGPSERFRIAAISKKPGKPAESAFKTMEKYLQSSRNDFAILKTIASAVPGREKTVDISLLRGSPAAQQLIADLLFDRERLHEGSWPKKNTDKYKQRRQYWRGCVLLAIEHAGPSILGLVASDLLTDVEDRMRYWGAELSKISATKAGIAVRASMLGPAQRVDLTREPELIVPVEREAKKPKPDAALAPEQAEEFDRRDPVYPDPAFLTRQKLGARVDKEAPNRLVGLHASENILNRVEASKAERAARQAAEAAQREAEHIANLENLVHPTH